MIIDNDPDFLEIMKELLSDLGHYPICATYASNGVIAEADLIISDQPLPIDQRVIYTSPSITKEGKRLIKPFSYNQLLSILER